MRYSLNGTALTEEQVRALPKDQLPDVVAHHPGGDVRPYRFVDRGDDDTFKPVRLSDE